MLWWCASALAAELWWVPDDTRAAELSAALAGDWPEADVTVRVGERGQIPGFAWDGVQVLVDTGEERRAADAADAHLAVLLARTWALHPDAGAESWVAPLPAPPPDPPPPPQPPVERPRWQLELGLDLRSDVLGRWLVQGAGLTVGAQRGPLWLAADGALGWSAPGSGALPEGGVTRLYLADNGSFGAWLGLRSTGRTWLGFAAGPRYCEYTTWRRLSAEGEPTEVSSSFGYAAAGAAQVGRDLGRLRLHGALWGRWMSDQERSSAGVTLGAAWRPGG